MRTVEEIRQKYEDDGLLPDDYKKLTMADIANMRLDIKFLLKQIDGFAKAKADGRLVVLPCKIGDEVWFLEKQLDIANGTCSTVISEYIVTEIRGNKYNPLWYMASSERCTHRDFHPTELGKTVFLTKEAAEKALGGKEDA